MAKYRFYLCLFWLVLVGYTRCVHERTEFRSEDTRNNGKGTEDDKIGYFSPKVYEEKSRELADKGLHTEDRNSDSNRDRTSGDEIKNEGLHMYVHNVRSVNSYRERTNVEADNADSDSGSTSLGGGYVAMIVLAVLTAISILALLMYLCATRCEALCPSRDYDTI